MPIKLYHGTPYTLTEIKLDAGRGYKDFGKGFYLATNRQQAVGMMNKKYRELSRKSPANLAWIKKNLYSFDFNKELLHTVSYKVFDVTDTQWLDFILSCRSCRQTPHHYDIVIGPTADDDTTFCLNNYREGLYGPPDALESKRVLMRNLETENLGTQVFVATSKGLTLLENMQLI
ncbi:DUF3990 domain-containing protein [Lacrimispora sp.]|uniref:DUF3990 domain-containing protein n=1 Tax=Lacrimispora sp. TaxID=2719234 RepID=UPI00345F954F